MSSCEMPRAVEDMRLHAEIKDYREASCNLELLPHKTAWSAVYSILISAVAGLAQQMGL
jgi:hypothetical protein